MLDVSYQEARLEDQYLLIRLKLAVEWPIVVHPSPR